MAARGVTIAQTDFPLYTIRFVGDRHFLAAGGGGAAKTGVPNALEIFELKYENKGVTARKVTHYETATRAIMNCAVASQEKQFALAAGLDDSCHLYQLRYKVITPKVENEALEGLRKRKGNLTMSTDHKLACKMIGFEIEPGEEVVTDFAKDGGFQKAVHFTKDLSHLVTAGADGYLRIWKNPSLEKVLEIKAHTNEVDDFDISPDGRKIVSVSKDNHSYVWDFKDGNKIQELVWRTDSAYRSRCCRFGVVKDKENAYHLFTAHVPIVRDKRSSCHIIKWETENFTPSKIVSTGREMLSALAVSDNGIYLGTGTISGSVSVYVAFSLQRLYHIPEVHRIFVTGLEFMPDTTVTRTVTGDFDFSLLSISADNQVKIHQQEKRVLYSPLWGILGCFIVIFLIFWVINALGL